MDIETSQTSMSGIMKISDKEFDLLRSLIHSHFGININEQKRTLLVVRLQKLLQAKGFETFREYYNYLIRDSSPNRLHELIDSISTNFSFFFREHNHFDYLSKTVLPLIVERQEKRNSKNIRIWSAGCSTGEEPYTIVMLMLEFLGMEYAIWNVGLLATDISTRALKKAMRGIYSQDKMRHVPTRLKKKFFNKADEGKLVINETIRNNVTFRRLNLMEPTFPFKKKFHIIFCRNVMIYFNKKTRNDLIRKFHQVSEPGSFLFIGHSEALNIRENLYKYVMPSTYVRI